MVLSFSGWSMHQCHVAGIRAQLDGPGDALFMFGAVDNRTHIERCLPHYPDMSEFEIIVDTVDWYLAAVDEFCQRWAVRPFVMAVIPPCDLPPETNERFTWFLGTPDVMLRRNRALNQRLEVGCHKRGFPYIDPWAFLRLPSGFADLELIEDVVHAAPHTWPLIHDSISALRYS